MAQVHRLTRARHIIRVVNFTAHSHLMKKLVLDFTSAEFTYTNNTIIHGRKALNGRNVSVRGTRMRELIREVDADSRQVIFSVLSR